MKCFRFEFLRMIRDKKLYISMSAAFILTVAQLIFSIQSRAGYEQYFSENYELMKNFYYPVSVFNVYIGLDSGMFSEILLFIMPAIAVIPFGSSFFDDKKSGYLKIMYTAADRKKYLTGKTAAVFLSGFIVTAFAFGSSLILTSMFFPALNPEPVTMTFGVIGDEYLWNGLYCSHPYIYSILFVIIDAVFTGIMNVAALALSTVTENRFSALFTPSLLYITVSYIFSCTDYPEWSPMNFLSAFQPVPCSLPAVTVTSVLILTASLAVIYTGEKKDVF